MSGLISQDGTSVQIADRRQAFDSLKAAAVTRTVRPGSFVMNRDAYSIRFHTTPKGRERGYYIAASGSIAMRESVTYWTLLLGRSGDGFEQVASLESVEVFFLSEARAYKLGCV